MVTRIGPGYWSTGSISWIWAQEKININLKGPSSSSRSFFPYQVHQTIQASLVWCRGRDLRVTNFGSPREGKAAVLPGSSLEWSGSVSASDPPEWSIIQGKINISESLRKKLRPKMHNLLSSRHWMWANTKQCTCIIYYKVQLVHWLIVSCRASTLPSRHRQWPVGSSKWDFSSYWTIHIVRMHVSVADPTERATHLCPASPPILRFKNPAGGSGGPHPGRWWPSVRPPASVSWRSHYKVGKSIRK